MSKNLNVLLREFVRQVLREAFENPPAADNKNRRDAFLGLLKPEIARGKSYPDNEQFVAQGKIAQQIFDFIDKNKNKEFEQDEIPDNEVWREEVAPLLQQLFGYRLMKMRSGVRKKKRFDGDKSLYMGPSLTNIDSSRTEQQQTWKSKGETE